MSGTNNHIIKIGGSTITVVENFSSLPLPSASIGKFYWCSNSQGTKWLPGSLGGTFYNKGMYYSNGIAWEFINVPNQATQPEVDTGSNNDKFVTPLTLKNSPVNDATQSALSGKENLTNKVTSITGAVGTYPDTPTVKNYVDTFVVPLVSTGTSIFFDRLREYNQVTPATGNLTNDLTGAQKGIIQKIYHNHSSAPTVPGGWVLIGGEYKTGELNIIYAEWCGSSRVEYWIAQEI